MATVLLSTPMSAVHVASQVTGQVAPQVACFVERMLNTSLPGAWHVRPSGVAGGGFWTVCSPRCRLGVPSGLPLPPGARRGPRVVWQGPARADVREVSVRGPRPAIASVPKGGGDRLTAPLPYRKRMEIIELYFQGYSYDDISTHTGPA